jgi:hypothetical protein
MMNIIEIAKEAGLHRTEWNDWLCYDKTLERFAALVRAEERKRSTKIESALKIIFTWASVDGALDPANVRDLCERSLK